MLVRRCDLCKKAIDFQKKNYMEISRAMYPRPEVCMACAEPIIRTLSKQRLLPKKFLKELQLANP